MADTIKRVYLIEATATDAVNELRRLQSEAASTTAAMKGVGAGAKGAGDDANSGAKGLGVFANASTGARRELLVLTHELSQGNFTRFAGSLLVLGERLNIMSTLFSATGLAVAGFTAVFAGVTALIIEGAVQQDKFNKSLLLTGNYAGQTTTSIRALSQDIAATTNSTVGAARDVIQELISTGRFGPTLIAPATDAILTLSRVTGQSTEDIVKDFSKIGDGVVKFADEHDKQYHAIDLTTRDYIRSLEESGQIEQAELVYLQALTEHLGGVHVTNLGAAATAWNALGKAIGDVKDAILNVGRELDIGAKIAKLQAEIKQGSVVIAGTLVDLTPGNIADLQKQSNELSLQLVHQTDNAAAQAAHQAIESQGKAGDDVVRELVNSTRTGSQRLTEVLNKFYAGVKQVTAEFREQNPTSDLSDDQIFQSRYGTSIDTEKAALTKKFGDRDSVKAGNATAAAQKELINSLTKENAALDDQIAQYVLLGKAVDQSTAAKIKARLANKTDPLSGVSAAQAAVDLAAAQAQDDKRDTIAAEKAHDSVVQRINDLKTQADAEALTGRAAAVAADLGEQSRHKIKGYYDETTQAYKDDSAALVENRNRLLDQAAARKIADADLASDEAIKKLQQETALIGLNSLARQQATNALKIQDAADKLIKDNPNLQSTIQADADANIARTNAAIKSNYDALRSFDAGAKTAFASYIEDADNAAKFSQEFFSGAFSQIEDIFVNFVKTGKLSFTNLFEFMAEEFIKQSVKINLSKILEGNQGDITSVIAKIFALLGGKLGSLGSSLGGAGDTSINDAETAKFLRQQSSASLGSVADNSVNDAEMAKFLRQQAGAATSTGSANTALQTLGTTTGEASSALTGLGDATDLVADSVDLFSDSTDVSTASLFDFSAALDDAIASLDASSGGGLGGLGSDGSDGGDGGGLADIFSSWFAKGGIMSSKGPIPLNTYAGGGIANRPQMAIFGEGRQNEAYVPLPDGKSIPVSMNGGSGDSGGGGMNVVIENHNSSDVSVKREKDTNGKDQLRIFVNAAKANILDDVYGGGPLDKALSSKYGVNRAAGTPRRGSFN